MGTLALSAARVVTPDIVLSPGTVEIDGGWITAVTPGGSVTPGGRMPRDITLAPGFIDLQVNGIGDVAVADADGADWAVLDRHLAAHGVTAWCPTLVSMALDAYPDALGRIAAAAGRPGPHPAVLGAHLEGPFLGGAPGAHRPEFVLPLDPAWLDGLPDIVRLVTLAPELEGAADAVGALARRNVVVALGHSLASCDQARAAADAGARLVTHCFNAMGAFHHREPGLVGAALTDDRLKVSLIADLVHVHPAALALAFRAKGRDGVVLVTDSVASAAHERDGVVRLEHGAPRLPDGTLAGSFTTMDAAVANVVRHAGVALEDALKAASANPAEVLGARDRGRIAPGCRADLVALDPDLVVAATWVGGEQVYRRDAHAR